MEEVEELVKELKEKKKRQEKKNEKQNKWLDIREEMSRLVQNIDFEQPMEEEVDESMEKNCSEQESMEISGDENVQDSQENTTGQQDTSPIVNFSMLLLLMYQKYRESKPDEQVNKTPVVQPFDCGEEKSPLPVSIFYFKKYFSSKMLKIFFF